ncbi:MAG TPA: Grx4 family monothiol glutaredoxin [Solirubrobacteraceae bacterium]|jgi:monothiol glutaredoxin|nr:Grx4 family monothiol glutaredoxin [Solirubrobacteraceae bacterium]
MSDQNDNPIRQAIAEAISENEVILFMKGSPEAPMCGFSARTVAALQALDTRFAAVDILPDPRIRAELSALSQWPTIPQLFVRGELVGGCDIVTEMFESGELAGLLGADDQAAVAEPAVADGSVLQIENRLS